MENGVVNIINGLQGETHRFSVACLTEAGQFRERLRTDILIHELHKPAGLSLALIRKLQQVINRENADIVHTHNWATLVYSAPALKLARRGRILHGEHAQFSPSELRPHRLIIRRLLYRFASLVHTVSKAQKVELEALGFPAGKIRAVVNGVDTSRFIPAEDRKATRESLGLPENAIVLGLVGRFGAYKRHAEMINAFEQLAQTKPDLHLLLAGAGGPMEKATRSQVASSPFQHRIKLSGFLSDPVPAYQAMDLLVIPSINEGLSNAALEAMATGLPVLAHHACGSAELIGNAPIGRVTDLSTVPQLTDALRDEIEDTSQLQCQGLEARKHVDRHFSLAAMLGHYREIYSQLAKTSPPS